MKRFIGGLLIIVIVVVVSILLGGCTENGSVKYWGGKTRINIPSDRQFVNMTWKDTEMWILTKQRSKTDTVRSVYFFKEKSTFGVAEGEVTIVEE